MMIHIGSVLILINHIGFTSILLLLLGLVVGKQCLLKISRLDLLVLRLGSAIRTCYATIPVVHHVLRHRLAVVIQVV